LPALDAIGSPWEVILVDDGSTDNTAARAEQLRGRYSVIRFLKLPSNQGLGAALRAGFALADGDWIATLDADLTFKPELIKTMLLLGQDKNLDLVAGSPYLATADMSDVPWSRRLPSLMINALYRGLFSLRLTAYTPILRLYRATRLHALELTSSGFEINAEIAARGLKRDWRVGEVPAVLSTRVSGESKLRRWRELSRHLRLILRLLSN
jgi:glycosyltransferase involved in cell wall biosynthesis